MKTALLAAQPGSMVAAMCFALRPSKSLRLLHAGSIEQVMERVMDANGRIDLLIADTWFQPGVCGIDLALNFRNLFPKVRILLVSSDATLHCTPQQRSCLLNLPRGTVAHLHAPLPPRDLRRRMDGLLAPLLPKVA